MTDRFDYPTLFELLAELSARQPGITFSELLDGTPPERFFLLRHDVDYAPSAALALAAREQRQGYRALYLLLPSSPSYNLTDPALREFPRRLVELGHEVGLHYDARLYQGLSPALRERLLDAQAETIAVLSGRPVRVIAMHQPALHGDDPFATHPRYHNAFGSPGMTGIEYVSDSCRAWRDETFAMLASGRFPARLQLSLHPINWAPRDRPRGEVFRAAFAEASRRLERERDWLLAAIASHTGVREHEARARQQDADQHPSAPSSGSPQRS